MLLSSEIIQDYTNTFIQPIPRYGIKTSRGWTSINGAISYNMIEKHLSGSMTLGSLARYYPEHAVIDIDDRPLQEAEEIQGKLKLDDKNSMLFTSESKDSWHILFRPQYRGKPPTINLLSEAMKPAITHQAVELYPQANRYCRAPFSKVHQPIDDNRLMITKEQQFQEFQELDEYNLEDIPRAQMQFDYGKFSGGPKKALYTPYQEGKELLLTGLQLKHTRHDSQFKVLYYLWRKNTPIKKAEATVWKWIKTRHNGYSEEIFTNPEKVKKEVIKQALHIWNKYTALEIYPDSTNNDYFGWITEQNFIELVKIARGKLPEIRFYYEFFKYCNARQTRVKGVSIHSDLMKQWGSNANYKKYLNNLESINLISRTTAYIPGLFSKRIFPQWKPADRNKKLMIDERSPELNQTVLDIIKPNNYRSLLLSLGVNRTTAIEQLKHLQE